MQKEIKFIFFNTILTVIITWLVQLCFTFIFSNHAKMEIITTRLSDGSYQSIIAIKNLKQNEYLKNIEIQVNDSINIISIRRNENVYDKKIYVDKINPKSVEIIYLISDKKIRKSDLTIIKNNQRIEIDSFNDYTDYKIRYFILIIIYALVNAFILYFIQKKIKKENDEILTKIELQKIRQTEVEERSKEIEKKLNIQKTIYLKEMNDLKKENEFYKQLLLMKCDNIQKEELEKIIGKQLKTFNKKNFKNLTYEDIYKIVYEMSNK